MDVFFKNCVNLSLKAYEKTKIWCHEMSSAEPSVRRKRRQKEREQLNFPIDYPAVDGEPLELIPGIYVIKMPLQMNLSHINVYLLERDDGFLIVDTGIPNEPTISHWRRLADTFFKEKPVVGILCTHFHYDHAGLAQFLSGLFHAPVHMSFGEYYTLRSLAVEHRDERIAAQRQFLCDMSVPMEICASIAKMCSADPYVTYKPKQFVRMHQNSMYEAADRTFRTLTGRGHSPEHICLFSDNASSTSSENAEGDEYFPAVLIAGDQLLPDISSNIFVPDTEPFADSLQHWFDSLNMLFNLPENTLVLPSHGSAFVGIKERVVQLKNHHQDVLDNIIRHAKNARHFTPFDALKWVFPHIHKPVDIMLAQSEVMAHINYLVSTNQLRNLSPRDGVGPYLFSLNVSRDTLGESQ